MKKIIPRDGVEIVINNSLKEALRVIRCSPDQTWFESNWHNIVDIHLG